MVAQGADLVAVQVQFSQAGAGGEGVVGEGRQEVGGQSQDSQGGQGGAGGQGHLRNLETRESISFDVALKLMFFRCESDTHLVGREVDLIDVCEALEGGPGQAGEQVPGKQEDLKERKEKTF